MRVAVVQHDIVWEDREATFARLAPRIEAAAGAGARIVLLSETFSTGFSMRTEVTAEPEGGPSSQFLAAQAKEHGVWVGGSCPEVRAEGEAPYNTFVLAGPDGIEHRYRKLHRFGYGGEDAKFSAGTEPVTVTVEGLRVTLFVCYDLRFADDWWVAAPGTDAYLCVANWPTPRRHHWRALLLARAIENQAYVVACNRVGRGGGKLDYAGDSMIVDPMGELLASAAGGEALLVADVDPARVAQVRAEFPFLSDRDEVARLLGR
jgi:omega-amidase